MALLSPALAPQAAIEAIAAAAVIAVVAAIADRAVKAAVEIAAEIVAIEVETVVRALTGRPRSNSKSWLPTVFISTIRLTAW